MIIRRCRTIKYNQYQEFELFNIDIEDLNKDIARKWIVVQGNLEHITSVDIASIWENGKFFNTNNNEVYVVQKDSTHGPVSLVQVVLHWIFQQLEYNYAWEENVDILSDTHEVIEDD